MSRIKGTITPSEYEVLEVMWNADEEMTASEIVKISQNKTWKSSSVHPVSYTHLTLPTT